MFDINAIINDAITAAVEKATAPLLERIANLESQSANRHARLRVLEGALTDRVDALESTSTQGIGVLLENLDNQEWFWHKIREFTGTVVEQAIENHTDCWDHNDFVTEDKLDDYVKTENLESEVCDVVRDIMEGATVSIRI